jgi:hypothetical protein
VKASLRDRQRSTRWPNKVQCPSLRCLEAWEDGPSKIHSEGAARHILHMRSTFTIVLKSLLTSPSSFSKKDATITFRRECDSFDFQQLSSRVANNLLHHVDDSARSAGRWPDRILLVTFLLAALTQQSRRLRLSHPTRVLEQTQQTFPLCL